eukprot:m.210956 g.210956  ORF g.210956 m.210956 type:complete len:88 (+) comp13783_c1_seq14:3404-3667(+)
MFYPFQETLFVNGQATSAPIHGHLESLRAILSLENYTASTTSTDINVDIFHGMWSSLLLILWDLLNKIAAKALPTVAALAPEGCTHF